MALTRRTARFAQFASQFEQLLLDDGFDVTSERVDAFINSKVTTIAATMGISPRDALLHAPDSLPADLLAEVRDYRDDTGRAFREN